MVEPWREVERDPFRDVERWRRTQGTEEKTYFFSLYRRWNLPCVEGHRRTPSDVPFIYKIPLTYRFLHKIRVWSDYQTLKWLSNPFETHSLTGGLKSFVWRGYRGRQSFQTTVRLMVRKHAWGKKGKRPLNVGENWNWRISKYYEEPHQIKVRDTTHELSGEIRSLSSGDKTLAN